MREDIATAVSIRFVVKLDDDHLGTFDGCEGLGVEVVLEPREEGGNNTMIRQLPTRLKYPNIKLTRPLGKETADIGKWFAEMATGYTRRNGSIAVMRTDGEVVATWHLIGMVPVRWTGPSLTADSPKVLTEVVEIAHEGFMPLAQAVPG